jgi:energy-coupling factor transporter ATP-binding protein EcfA2
MVKPALNPENERERSGRQRGGGPAAAGGYNYQAAVTGIAMAHALSGAPLGWLDGLLFDAPCEIGSETGGGGDDIRLTFGTGDVAEAQVKKGLRAGKDLKAALAGLAEAIHSGKIAFGCLIVDPSSSRTVTHLLAADLIRLAEDTDAKVGTLAAKFRTHLSSSNMDVQSVCSRLRIVTVPALEGDNAAIRTAMAHLGQVCAESSEATLAWDRLYRDAHLMMARRGRRTRSDIARVLRSANVRLSADPSVSPAGVLSKLCDWTLQITAEFSILGVRKPVAIDQAWLPLGVAIRDELVAAEEDDLAAAVARYHSGPQTKLREQKNCDPITLGRFRRHVVIVGGAGAGKTTLLKKLARIYAKDNLPVLLVSALAVARRMISAGEGFATAAFAIGLDESGLAPEQARGADLGDWVILCDGLDECGPDQQRLAQGLVHFVAGQPNVRVAVTTRSIGYRTAALANWRHYDLVAGSSLVAESIAKLLSHILQKGQEPENLRRTVDEALEESDAGRTAARSPLLLSLCAALIARGASLGRTRLQFYRAVFALLESEPPPRAGPAPTSSFVLGRFLEVLGWTLVTDARAQANVALRACADVLQSELDMPALKALDLAERCFAYWQALGVVERVHHAGDEALTFVHKTFAEFASGRFMAALPPDRQAEILASQDDVAGLSETIAFASALGAGPVFVDDLLRRGFAGVSGQMRLLQALEVLSEADPPIDAWRVGTLVAIAADRLAGNHRTWALEVGAALIQVATRYGNLVAPAVRSLRSSTEQTWTCLSAWAVMFASEPDELTLEELLPIMESLAKEQGGDIKPLLGGGIGLAGGRGRALLESFAYGIAQRIVSERSGPAAEQLLSRFAPLVDKGSYGFYQRLSALGRAHGVQSPSPNIENLASMPDWDFSKLGRAMRTALTTIMTACGADEAVDVTSAPNDGPLFNLAGFLSVVGLREAGMSEFWPWLEPFDIEDVTRVYQNLAMLAGVPLDRMAAEAAVLRQEIRSSAGDGLSPTFDRIPEMDTNELDPRCIDGSMVDFTRVERALRHGSNLVVVTALNLALLVGTLEVWHKLAANLLENGTDDTVWAAVHIAKKLPEPESLALLFSHTITAPRSGSQHVVDQIAKICPVDDLRRSEALRWALLNDQVQAATSAAKWARDVPNVGSEREASLLLEAFDHWRRIEEPYPTGGGTIPPSPRAQLVEALAQVGRAHLETLISWVEDTRSDVVEAARKALIELITRDADARSTFVELATAGLPLPTLKTALADCTAFTESECAKLLDLLESEDANLRYVAMPLLNLPHVPGEKRAQALQILRNDPEPQIRETAVRMIG